MRVTQPYDGELIAEIPVDGTAGIEAKLEAAAQLFSDRANWLPRLAAHRHPSPAGSAS
jgi:acyl-CoA reductase-like NAD-dependent aldehyde dehydrogenase